MRTHVSCNKKKTDEPMNISDIHDLTYMRLPIPALFTCLSMSVASLKWTAQLKFFLLYLFVLLFCFHFPYLYAWSTLYDQWTMIEIGMGWSFNTQSNEQWKFHVCTQQHTIFYIYPISISMKHAHSNCLAYVITLIMD